MKFAFLVHPISADTAALLQFDQSGSLRNSWGVDPLAMCANLHQAVNEARRGAEMEGEPQPRVIDEFLNMQSPLGGMAEGRLIQIPMDALAILEDPDRALGYMEQAVEMAVEWGAKIVGLGSMTGVVGGRGTYLAERSPIAITTGNSLTVYSALQNLYQAATQFDIDLSREVVAVVGVPGSIASAVASLLAPQCERLILVGRNSSGPARKLAEQLGADLCLDIPQALREARIIVTATSTGSCIDQTWLQPGSLVIDVGVPTDVQGTEAIRNDVLMLTGGLIRLPQTMPLDSKFLWFQHGMVPSCLGETTVLALENRAECLSLGRTLDLDTIQSIGSVARAHGFDFSKLYSFGHPLDQSAIVRFQKARSRLRGNRRGQLPPSAEDLAPRAAETYARHVNPVMVALGKSSDFVKTFVRGEGAYLYDAAGKRYLDFVAGFGSLNLGHNHPTVVSAVQEALRTQAPGFAQSAVNPYAAALSKELVALAPASLEMAFFANSGTEANEAALKLARIATGRTGVLFCERSYHGKSLGSLSVTGNPEYRRPFGPLVPECESIPYGDYNALDRALSTRRFAAFIVEPLQAEGGMNVPPPGYLREAQAICRTTGTLLIVDEVQTGLGRTGTMFAVEREGVDPDVMTLAKSLGGGLMPIGAMLARRDLWMKSYGTLQTFSLHTSTFGGGSLACAAGLAALETIVDEDLAANAAARGEELYRGLNALCQRVRCLKEVRGRGLLLGLEFQQLAPHIKAHWRAIDQSGLTGYLIPNLDKMVDSIHVMHAMQTLLHAHSVYTQVARSNPQLLRIQPPLNITAEQVQQFLSAIEATCEEIDYSTSLIDGMIAKTGIGQHNASDRHASAESNGKPHVHG
jgi:acetylornithine/succinyldiaminopimelate/putrescine aminotransferase/predicted amino acid dehydrogenase